MSLKSLKGKASRLKERLRSFLGTVRVRRRLADFLFEASVLVSVLGVLEMVVANFNAPVKLTIRQFSEVLGISLGTGVMFFSIGCTI
jgi:hypothetical protein